MFQVIHKLNPNSGQQSEEPLGIYTSEDQAIDWIKIEVGNELRSVGVHGTYTVKPLDMTVENFLRKYGSLGAGRIISKMMNTGVGEAFSDKLIDQLNELQKDLGEALTELSHRRQL